MMIISRDYSAISNAAYKVQQVGSVNFENSYSALNNMIREWESPAAEDIIKEFYALKKKHSGQINDNGDEIIEYSTILKNIADETFKIDNKNRKISKSINQVLDSITRSVVDSINNAEKSGEKIINATFDFAIKNKMYDLIPQNAISSYIDKAKPFERKQFDKYNSKGKRITGLCNVASLSTLLNRRLVLDGKYSDESAFTEKEIYSAFGDSNIKYCKNGNDVISSADTGKWVLLKKGGIKRTYTNKDGVTYATEKYLNKNELQQYSEDGTIKDDQDLFKAVANLIDKHPEGVCMRGFYDGEGGHVIVVKGYEKDENGIYNLKIYDPVNSCDTTLYDPKYADYNDKKIKDSWYSKECRDGGDGTFLSNFNLIVHLDSN